MLRTTLLLVIPALGLVGHLKPVLGQEQVKKELAKAEKAAASLKVGDPAPDLKASKWLQGDAVKKFEPGKIYVVEFWATWCGAPIRYMPHLADLQARYKDQGVTVISFTSRDIRGGPGNTEDKVAAFVKKRGPTLKYRFAYADDGSAADAWLKGQEHFCTFVVDKTGRIAYIGGPMFVSMALHKVVAGGSAKEVGDDMAKVDADYRAVIATLERDPEAGLAALKDFETQYPLLADFLPVVAAKLHELLKLGNVGKGEEYAEALVAKAIKQKNAVVLEMAYWELRNKKDSKELVALAVRAADALVRMDGGKDPQSLLHLADAYSVSGDKGKAKEYARKALNSAANEPSTVQKDIEKEARKLGAEK
ncbi:MAG: redoxin domain-containing protein [Gemmataceae bacterium]